MTSQAIIKVVSRELNVLRHGLKIDEDYLPVAKSSLQKCKDGIEDKTKRIKEMSAWLDAAVKENTP